MGQGQKNIESKQEKEIETFKDIKLSKNRGKPLIVNKCHGMKSFRYYLKMNIINSMMKRCKNGKGNGNRKIEDTKDFELEKGINRSCHI